MAGHRITPPDLRGRPHPDRMLRMLETLVAGFAWVSRSGAWRRRPVVPVNRELPLVVAEVRVEADDVRSFRLADPDGAGLPAWEPGCHLDVRLPSGRRRQYSLCGDPADRGSYRIAVRRTVDSAGGSRELHDSVVAGSRLTIRGPRNAFPCLPADRYLFIAGGIGITPILPMVRQAAARGADWRLVYTGRHIDSMPFLDEIAALGPDRVWIRPDTRYGVPTSAAELLAGGPRGAAVYCCGPLPMMAGVRRALPTCDAVALHVERFCAPPVRDATPFEIVVAGTGRVLTVPADRSALDVLREVRPEVAYSCRQGFCGTCRTRVLSGEVDHRDRVLTDAERADTMTICVSRARTARLLLEL